MACDNSAYFFLLKIKKYIYIHVLYYHILHIILVQSAQTKVVPRQDHALVDSAYAVHVSNANPTDYSVFQPFSSCGTFETLCSVWRNLHTQNSANLRILMEPG